LIMKVGKGKLFLPLSCDDLEDLDGDDFIAELYAILEDENCPHGAVDELTMVFGGQSKNAILDQIRDNGKVWQSQSSGNNPFDFLKDSWMRKTKPTTTASG
jgi:hypothetical protein